MESKTFEPRTAEFGQISTKGNQPADKYPIELDRVVKITMLRGVEPAALEFLHSTNEPQRSTNLGVGSNDSGLLFQLQLRHYL